MEFWGGGISSRRPDICHKYIKTYIIKNMKSHRVSFDFSDHPKLLEALRKYAAERGISQKGILIEALESYFAEKLESQMLVSAANVSFAEWDNEGDEIYNSLWYCPCAVSFLKIFGLAKKGPVLCSHNFNPSVCLSFISPQWWQATWKSTFRMMSS